MQEVADLVGIHKSTLFHYFKNKEELLLEILELSIAEVSQRLDQILSDITRSPEEKLHRAMVNHLNMLTRYVDNVNVYHSDIRCLSERNKQKYLRTRKHYEKSFTKIVSDIKKNDRSRFTDLNSRLVAFGILGMCNWVAKWYQKKGAFKPEEIASAFYQMIK